MVVNKKSTEITGVWLKGGKNEVTVALEVDDEWIDVITEYMPTQGNDGSIWPISHIKEMPIDRSREKKIITILEEWHVNARWWTDSPSTTDYVEVLWDDRKIVFFRPVPDKVWRIWKSGKK